MKSFSTFIAEAKETSSDIEKLKDEAVSFLRGNGGRNVHLESRGNGFDVESRYWGKWEMPEGEDDDEDYDWEVPTKETSLKMKTFVDSLSAKYKGFKIHWTTSEKNWIMIQVSK